MNLATAAGEEHRFSDPIRDVNGIKIRVREEPVHRLEPNMVGIDMIGLRPAEFLDGGIGGGASGRRFGTDGGVFAIGFVPDGDDIHAAFGWQAGRLGVGPLAWWANRSPIPKE